MPDLAYLQQRGGSCGLIVQPTQGGQYTVTRDGKVIATIGMGCIGTYLAGYEHGQQQPPMGEEE